MADAETQAPQEQGQVELIKQLQAALAARQQQPAAAPAPTFSPSEHRQFARFGLDPRRLRFLNTLADFRRGMNLERDLFGRALTGAAAPTSGGDTGEEELAPFA